MQKPAAKAKTEAAATLPAQFTLLETKVRFETNGDSRKEVHALVKINNEIGVNQFGRLYFNLNRSFESVEIPFVRITHASGGTVDVLPSAITDQPNPAVVTFPAYQEIRVKSVRILGLAPNDALEYRVITTTTHHPLAPDFWFEHSLDRTGVVDQELFQLDLPISRVNDSPGLRRIELQVNPETPAETSEAKDADGSARRIYRWKFLHPGATSRPNGQSSGDENQTPDIQLSSYVVWGALVETLAKIFHDGAIGDSTVAEKAALLTKGLRSQRGKLAALYDFVSQKISTVDLPLGVTGFRTRPPAETLSSGYAAPVDKFLLFAALASAEQIELSAAMTRIDPDLPKELPSPALFTHILSVWGSGLWLDPNLEVAAFGLVTPALHGKPALWIRQLPRCGPTEDCAAALWLTVPRESPLAFSQRVRVGAALTAQGSLSATVKYDLRGDNELLLRIAFHRTVKENWNNVAQLLALSDGFRGKVTKAAASDPYDTHHPFHVEYEITQPKFLDWAKKPVRIPALLPVLGLPDPPAKATEGSTPARIELGTPLDVEVSGTLRLPAGTTAQIPAGTSVERDFATYSSQYSTNGLTIAASRHLNFILRELPANRAADYAAFLRSVQNDESQVFTLERPVPSAEKAPPNSNHLTAPQRP